MPNFRLWLASLLLIAFWGCQSNHRQLLVYIPSDLDYDTKKFYTALTEKLEPLNQGYHFQITNDASLVSEYYLPTYDGVIFMGANGDGLNAYQRADLERFIQAGGKFWGINALSHTDRHWLWYGALTGALNENESQPYPSSFHDSITVEDLKAEKSYSRKPITWQINFDGGQAQQVIIPVDEQVLADKSIVKELTESIKSLVENAEVDYSKARTDRVPEENRFTKQVLATNLYEPMELDIFPDDKVIFVERRGEIKVYDPETETLDTIVQMPVHTKFEDGLMGIAIDPNYETNHWIYLYYSPIGDIPKQHLSRFVFKDNQIDFESEKVVLVVDVQRDECCHSGGSLEFGPDGLLYLSTGDDTNPFASNGFAPIDERSGRSPWDAQKSSANTNDLRGKILRIKPEADGTYSIPEGNLFPVGKPNTRPEIYVMGCRNPFRISIDSRTNFLYWGDVGPDSGKDKVDRGPRGVDEINQARHAGFWGWPYTRGNNIVYHDYDFKKKQSGQPFKPDNLINDSPNNTGLTRLPPAQKSLVWYSYGESEEFPWVGKGGKNPMAGPIYYSEDYTGDQKFPAYFDGKLIAYEWMRHWMYVITMDENHDFVKAEPFMPNTTFARPMDMAFDSKGRLYVIEYGDKWFAQNEEAVLSVIEYNGGNRAPIAQLDVKTKYGAVPFQAELSAANSIDYDQDVLTYSWKVDGAKVAGSDSTLVYTFGEEGTYEVEVIVTDPSGASSSTISTLHAGNSAPVVEWKLQGNQSFFWPGRQLDYEVVVMDAEDGQEIAADRLNIAFDYLPLGEDITEIAQGHAAQMTGAQIALGGALMDKSDCKVCHAINKKIAGPSYHDIARFYEQKPDAVTYLANKIIKGGGGVWGETVMAAHPDLTIEEAQAMAKYVLSLTELDTPKEAFAQKGTYELTGQEETGQYILWSAYTDNGTEEIESITIEDQIKLRYYRLQAEQCDAKSEAINSYFAKEDNASYLTGFRHGDFFAFDQVDLTEVQALKLKMKTNKNNEAKLELFLDKNSTALASLALENSQDEPKVLLFRLPEGLSGFHRLTFQLNNESAKSEAVGRIDWVEFVFEETKDRQPID